MPKVTEEYIQNKKCRIMEAAYAVCLKKTVSTVTMQDIINETGLGQGGIYRFYKDIDEIFRDMILYLRKKEDLKGKTDEILAKADELPPKEITNLLFDMLADFMKRELAGIEKIDLELSVLAMNDPARVDKILKYIPEAGNKEYLTIRTMEYFTRQAALGRIRPRVSVEELLSYIAAAYTGIQTECIVSNCYRHERNPFVDLFQPEIQFRTLARTVNYLIGEE